MNQIESYKYEENQIKIKNADSIFQDNNKDNYLKSFNRTIPSFSFTNNEEKLDILNSGNVKNPEYFCNNPKISGYRPSITNNINIKNINIINYNESSCFNNSDNNNNLLFQHINLNNDLKHNNIINNNINNSLNENNFINFSVEIENNKNKNSDNNLTNIENIYKLYNNKIQLLNKDGLTKIMKNKFGNYFMQEIIRKADYEQVKMILFLISDNFIEISENISGTYVIQRLLDKINNFVLRMLVLKLIENRELEMAFNSNATYVLQKIIEKVPDVERIQLNEIIINNILFLSLNPDCVFIVEKFIDTTTINLNKIKIQNIISIHCLQISNNPYGNYLIQYILKVWKNENISNIINIIIQNSYLMVQQRYASNVIEKCFEIFDDKKRKKILINICLGGDILNIIKNQYGHYVLNKTIKYIDEDMKIQIENILNNKMQEMSKKEKSKSKKFISLLKNSKFKKIGKK